MHETYTTHQLISNEVSASEIISGEHAVKAAIQATGKQHVIRSIWMNAPVLEQVATRLGRMFSQHYPSTNEDSSLLSDAFKSASEAYVNSVKEGRRQEDHELSYLMALHEVMMGFQNFSAVAVLPDGETQIWLPFGLPLIDWVKKIGAERVGFIRTTSPISDRLRKAGRLILATYMLRYERAEEVYQLLENDNVL